MKIVFREAEESKSARLPRLLENIRHAEALGIPLIPRVLAPVPRPLAIVGGGPSIRHQIDRLKAWPGDIWAINGTWRYLADRGIDATFLSVDPAPAVETLCRGAKRAIVASCCDPAVFRALEGADVHLVNIAPHPQPMGSGPTTATASPHLAVYQGYGDLTWFGCESSYEHDPRAQRMIGGTHAYMAETVPDLIRVECGGAEYLTEPEYLMQAEALAGIIRDCRPFLKEESGGLLRALIEHGDYDIVAVAPGIYAEITQAA